jgi:hypothetical protein
MLSTPAPERGVPRPSTSHFGATRRFVFAGLGVAMLAGGCGDDQAPGEARELLDRVRAEDYRAWTRAPGYETRRSSRAPHSDAVEIFVNEPIVAALETTPPVAEWPVGAIIVKEGWDGGDLELIALMEKREDGWFWAEFFGSDSKYSGRPELCIDCHARGDDFVRAFGFDAVQP